MKLLENFKKAWPLILAKDKKIFISVFSFFAVTIIAWATYFSHFFKAHKWIFWLLAIYFGITIVIVIFLYSRKASKKSLAAGPVSASPVLNPISPKLSIKRIFTWLAAIVMIIAIIFGGWKLYQAYFKQNKFHFSITNSLTSLKNQINKIFTFKKSSQFSNQTTQQNQPEIKITETAEQIRGIFTQSPTNTPPTVLPITAENGTSANNQSNQPLPEPLPQLSPNANTNSGSNLPVPALPASFGAQSGMFPIATSTQSFKLPYSNLAYNLPPNSSINQKSSLGIEEIELYGQHGALSGLMEVFANKDNQNLQSIKESLQNSQSINSVSDEMFYGQLAIKFIGNTPITSGLCFIYKDWIYYFFGEFSKNFSAFKIAS